MLVFQLEKQQPIELKDYLQPNFKGIGHRFFERSIGVEKEVNLEEFIWGNEGCSQPFADPKLQQYEPLQQIGTDSSLLKMWELAAFLDPTLVQISNSKAKSLKCFHLSKGVGPGSFVSGLKRIIDIRFPSIVWECDETPPGCWCDKDYLRSENIRSWSTAQYNLVICSDEVANEISMLGQMCSIFGLLTAGGIFIIRTSILDVGTLALLTTKFDRVMIVKPETSSVLVNELFIVGIGFKGIAASEQNTLLNLLDWLPHTPTLPQLFRRAAISHDFVKNLISIDETIKRARITSIEKLRNRQNQLAHLSDERRKIVLGNVQDEKNEWISHFNAVI